VSHRQKGAIRLGRREVGAEELNYKGYRLQVSPQGPGWKVIIYAPGAMLGLDEIPYIRDPAGRDQVIEEAREIVDRLSQGHC
jgi:hypothetical protein